MRDRSLFKPNLVVVAGDARDDKLTQNVISRLPNAKIEFIDSDLDVGSLEKQIFSKHLQNKYTNDIDDLSPDVRFTEGKRILILLRHKGSWLKSCPGTSSHVCCNLFTVDPGEGCPLDCTYCYLQSYLKNNPVLKLYSNTESLLLELADKFTSDKKRLFRSVPGSL